MKANQNQSQNKPSHFTLAIHKYWRGIYWQTIVGVISEKLGDNSNGGSNAGSGNSAFIPARYTIGQRD